MENLKFVIILSGIEKGGAITPIKTYKNLEDLLNDKDFFLGLVDHYKINLSTDFFPNHNSLNHSILGSELNPKTVSDFILKFVEILAKFVDSITKIVI